MSQLDAILSGRISKNRAVLFQKNDQSIQYLLYLLGSQTRKTIILWALDLAQETVEDLKQKYPTDDKAEAALHTTRLWAQGVVKMPIAKRAILDCHAVAKTLDSLEDVALYHAVGQACSTVHACGHAIGYPIYDLTAIVRKYGINGYRAPLEQRIAHYIERLQYCELNQNLPRQWAKFIQD
ncbi:MAG: hypothetical protein SO434_06245 [Eubacteriales bacterium]|nr:hypothetical protein [Eubacteriales bacterium]